MHTFERFLEYVKINTQSDKSSGTHPSFTGEFDLANRLKEELEGMGLSVHIDSNCYLMAKLPATKGCERLPVIGFISHLDTAPDYSGQDVRPVIHKNYDGKDVTYPCGKVMKVEDFPHLKNLQGETLITSDGNTLLGADDKAGVAEIMTAVDTIVKEDLPHGEIAIAFTPDEEIGEGTDGFDLERFGAEYAYTVDGGDVNIIEYENFNAASADILIKGVSIHPGSAKNMMVNALNVAHDLHAMLPKLLRPEHTEGYEGFYHLTDMEGSCSRAELHYIIRDHDRQRFEDKKEYLKTVTDTINAKYGADTAELSITDSYYNMLEKIKPHMHIIETAKKAVSSVGLTPVESPIRGGTDGARLSYLGLPCPNLGTGGFNYHGPYECITAERMELATRVILKIISLNTTDR